MDTATLRAVAARLETSARTVRSALPTSSTPDVGRSSREVTAAREFLDDHAARLGTSLANAAAALAATADAYDEQDAAAAARLRGLVP